VLVRMTMALWDEFKKGLRVLVKRNQGGDWFEKRLCTYQSKLIYINITKFMWPWQLYHE
jgi:hypothetical protein